MDNLPTFGDRRGPRQTVSSPIYVHLGPTAVGFLCDLSEGGLAVDVFGRIPRKQIVRLEFGLPDTSERIEAAAQVSWTSESARRAGLQFVDISERLAQRIGDWISLQNASRAAVATPAKAEETVRSETSSVQSETERPWLWSDEHLAELRTALRQAQRFRKPERSRQIIHWLRTPVDSRFVGFSLGLGLLLGTLVMSAYVLTQRPLQVHTTQVMNAEPVRPSEPSEASMTPKPAPSGNVSLNPSGIPEGAILLQVAALTRERDALVLAETLQQKKYPAFVRSPDADGYYRVQVGPYVDVAAARAARRRLQNDGFQPIVKR